MKVTETEMKVIDLIDQAVRGEISVKMAVDEISYLDSTITEAEIERYVKQKKSEPSQEWFDGGEG